MSLLIKVWRIDTIVQTEINGRTFISDHCVFKDTKGKCLGSPLFF